MSGRPQPGWTVAKAGRYYAPYSSDRWNVQADGTYEKVSQ